MAKSRKIEVDERTADLLEARARARSMSVAELVADLAVADAALPAGLAGLRDEGRGPWAPDVLAEDARRLAAYRSAGHGISLDAVEAWVKSWGTANELPGPRRT